MKIWLTAILGGLATLLIWFATILFLIVGLSELSHTRIGHTVKNEISHQLEIVDK